MVREKIETDNLALQSRESFIVLLPKLFSSHTMVIFNFLMPFAKKEEQESYQRVRDNYQLLQKNSIDADCPDPLRPPMWYVVQLKKYL